MFSNRVQEMTPSGIRKFFSLAAKMDRCLDLSIGQPHFDVPDQLKSIVKSAIDDGHNSYTPSLGIDHARYAIKEKYKIDGDNNFDVIVTSGVSGALFLVFAAILDEGSEILIPDPYFVGYKEIPLLLGAKPVPFDTYPDFVPKPEILESLISPKTRAIVVSNPSNPTGYVLSKIELDSLSQFAKEKGIYLIYDEIYESFCYDSEHLRPELSDKIIILNGLSKSFAMTGWRLGWVVASSPFIDQLQKIQQFSYVCAPAPFQRVIPAALKFFNETNISDYKAKRDKAVLELSKKFEFIKPGGAFYVFPKVSTGSASHFVEKSINKSVLVIPGNVFSRQDTHFRLSFAVKDDVLEEALETLLLV